MTRKDADTVQLMMKDKSFADETIRQAIATKKREIEIVQEAGKAFRALAD